MKVLKVLTAMAVVALTGFALTLAFADDATNTPPAAHHGSHGKKPPFDHILPPKVIESLALTAEQKTALESLDEAFKKDAEKWHAENPIDEAALKLARENHDKAALHEFNEKQKGLMEIRKGYVQKFRALLTDEQKATLDKELEEMRSKHPHPGNHDTPPPAP